MDNFNSLEELYVRLLPAFDSKLRELNKLGYTYIKREDIWNYLTIECWSKCDDLSLYKMVDDILNVENESLNNYVLKLLEKEKRNIKEMDVL